MPMSVNTDLYKIAIFGKEEKLLIPKSIQQSVLVTGTK